MEFGDLAQLFGEILTRHGSVRKHPTMHCLFLGVCLEQAGTPFRGLVLLTVLYARFIPFPFPFPCLLFLYYHSVLLYD